MDGPHRQKFLPEGKPLTFASKQLRSLASGFIMWRLL